MADFITAVYISFIIQAGGALLTAAVFRSFQRYYQKTYLTHLQWSWLALSVHLLAGAVGLYLSTSSFPATHPARILVNVVGGIAGFTQIPLVLFGTYELTTGRSIPPDRVRRALFAAQPPARDRDRVRLAEEPASRASFPRVRTPSDTLRRGLPAAAYGICAREQSFRGLDRGCERRLLRLRPAPRHLPGVAIYEAARSVPAYVSYTAFSTS